MNHIPATIMGVGSLEEDIAGLDGKTYLVIGWYLQEHTQPSRGWTARYVFQGDKCLVGERR